MNCILKEIAKRLSLYNVVQILSWEQLNLPRDIAYEVEASYHSGYYKDAKHMIREYSKTETYQLQKEVINEWMTAKMILDKAEKHVVITHAQLMTLPEEILDKYELVIDEDYLYTGLRSMGAIAAEEVKILIEAGRYVETGYTGRCKWISGR